MSCNWGLVEKNFSLVREIINYIPCYELYFDKNGGIKIYRKLL